MQLNTTKAKLKSGETVLGCLVRYADPTLIEVLGYQPWDFLVFDGEHGPLEPRDCENMVRAAELRGVTPIVRVPTNQPAAILRFMDTGTQGVHVPWVNSTEEADAAVRAVKYHPRGNRGLASVRAASYGQTMTFGQYVEQANAETLVVLHIETAQAVEHASAIASLDAVDVVFIGPTDLSQSYGVPGQPQHPLVENAMMKIVQAVSQTPAALGVLVSDAESARLWRSRGARYLVITLDAVLNPAVQMYISTVRGT